MSSKQTSATDAPAVRRVSRRQVLWGLGGVAIVGGGIGGGVAIWKYIHEHSSVYTYHGYSYAVSALAWSPDGRRLACGGEGRVGVYIWDALTGEHLVITASDSTDPLQANTLVRAQSLAWSPDGTRLVSGGDSAVVWDVRSGNMRTMYERTYKGPQGDQLVLEQTTVAWSPDGQHVVSGGDQLDPSTRNWTAAQVWDAATGHPVRNLFDPTPDSVAGRLYSAAWSPDGSQIATAGTGYAHRDGDLLATFQIWQAATGTLLFTWRGTASPSAVNSISWAPDNRRVVIGDVRDQAQVWDISSQRLLQTYHGHSHSINAVCWSPDGQWIASASSDTTAQVWDPQTGQTAYTYRGHSASVNALAWSPDSTYLASGSDDQTVQVWRAH